MIRIKDDGTVVEREEYRAILVGLTLGENIDYSMKELEGLAEADGIEVLGTMVQKVEKINAATFIGSGNGHGAGASQWGCKDLGKLGYKYDQILYTYYPHTELSYYKDYLSK